MASILSTSILAPCATTFGIERQNPSSKIVSTQKMKLKKQKIKKQRKKINTLKQPDAVPG